MSEIVYTIYTWKFGELYLAATQKGICRIDFSRAQSEKDFVDALESMSAGNACRDDQYFGELRSELDRYFAGEKLIFNDPLDFLSGTDFQKKVWQAVAKIPYGQVRTYGDIAKTVGNPKAVRAVGGANGANPIPILVSCHRVVAAGGKLGGYGGGLDIKEYLLRLEGAWGDST